MAEIWENYANHSFIIYKVKQWYGVIFKPQAVAKP